LDVFFWRIFAKLLNTESGLKEIEKRFNEYLKNYSDKFYITLFILKMNLNYLKIGLKLFEIKMMCYIVNIERTAQDVTREIFKIYCSTPQETEVFDVKKIECTNYYQ